MVSPIVMPTLLGPLRVALMLESDGPGGAESMLLQLAAELRSRGHEVLPVGPDNRTGWLAERFRDRGFSPATYSLRRTIDLACLRGLARLLQSHRIQVVHSHEFEMAVYGAAAARRIGARHVITMHGGRYFAGRWRRRAALRWAMRRSHATVGVSASTVDDLRRTLHVPHEAVTVVPNGIELRTGSREAVRRELDVPADTMLLAAVGNLYPVKGHMILLRALAELDRVEDRPSWRLAIAGRGDEERSLREFIDTAGLTGRVHLLGFRTDIPDILAAADLFVMPSLSEGLPLALVEAMSVALPIVASRVGGIPEVVVADEEALLVPPGNPTALGAALARLGRDAALRVSIGRAAQRRALRDFTVSTMCDAYEQLYRGTKMPAGATTHPAIARTLEVG